MKPNSEMKPYEVVIVLVVALALGSVWGLYVDRKNERAMVEAERQEEIWTRVADRAVLADEIPVMHDTVVVFDALDAWQQLLMAIAYTESRFNPQAVGKAHDSGVLQLTPIYIREVNRIAGTDYQLADAFDIDTAMEIFALMQEHYNPEHDVEKAIRLHNRNPYYRREVLKNLEFIKHMEDVREALKK